MQMTRYALYETQRETQQGDEMRWTTWMKTSLRVVTTVAVVALTIVVDPGTEVILNGIKWT
jgi:hypothetical protein